MNTQHQPSDYNDTHEIPEDELSLTTLFRAGGSLYGLDSSLVREVVRAGDITRVYDAPPDILGVRNLRGRIVTIVDMGIHLGTEASRRHRDNRLILIDHDGDTYGFLVDAVLEAVSPDPGELMPPTGNLTAAFSRRLLGLWRYHGEIASILSAETLFDENLNDTAEQQHSL